MEYSTWSKLLSLLNAAQAMSDGSINTRILDSVVWTVAHSLIRMPTRYVIIGSRYYHKSYRFVTIPPYKTEVRFRSIEL